MRGPLLERSSGFVCRELLSRGRWGIELAKILQDTNFGIVCLTPENLGTPWLLYEAGALSKDIEDGRVCSFLLDLKWTDIGGPFTQFQHTEALKKEDVFEMIKSVNTALEKAGEKPVPADVLTASFDK